MKTFKRFLVLFIFAQLFLFTSCDNHYSDDNGSENNPNQNETNNSWSFDAERHWHDESDLALHVWKETVIENATYTQEGSTLCTCTVCGYEKVKVIPKLSHVHNFSDEWSYDNCYHWHSATCGHDDEKSDEEEHTWIETVIDEPTALTCGKTKFECKICGYSKIETTPDLPPENISDFAVVSTEKEEATISWKNPSDSDFDKVIISYGVDLKKEIPGQHDETVTLTLKALENGTMYVLKFNAVDKNGNVSLPVKVEVPVYGGLYGKALNGQKPGDVISSDLFGLAFTSEVVIIPQNTTAVFGMPDNSSWNEYFPETDPNIPEYYKGAFVKDRKIRLSPFSIGQYNVTEELWDKVMVSEESERRDSKAPVSDDFYKMCMFCNELTKLVYGDESQCVYYIDEELTELYSEESCHPQKVYRDKVTGESFPMFDPVTNEPIPDLDSYKPVYPAYDMNECKWSKKGYRLPTEAEWEYAARGGNPNAPEWGYAFAGVQYPYMLIDRSKAGKGKEGYSSTGEVYTSVDPTVYEYAWYNSYFANEQGLLINNERVGMKKENTLHLYDMCGYTEECLYDALLKDVTAEDYRFMKGGYVTNPIGAEKRDSYNTSRSYNFNSVGVIDDVVSFRGYGVLNFYSSGYSFRLARSLE